MKREEITAEHWERAGKKMEAQWLELSKSRRGEDRALGEASFEAMAFCNREAGIERAEDRRRAVLLVTAEDLEREIAEQEKRACNRNYSTYGRNESAVSAWLLRMALEHWGDSLDGESGAMMRVRNNPGNRGGKNRSEGITVREEDDR